MLQGGSSRVISYIYIRVGLKQFRRYKLKKDKIKNVQKPKSTPHPLRLHVYCLYTHCILCFIKTVEPPEGGVEPTASMHTLFVVCSVGLQHSTQSEFYPNAVSMGGAGVGPQAPRTPPRCVCVCVCVCVPIVMSIEQFQTLCFGLKTRGRDVEWYSLFVYVFKVTIGLFTFENVFINFRRRTFVIHRHRQSSNAYFGIYYFYPFSVCISETI